MKYLRGQIIKQIDIADDFYEAYRWCFNTGANRIYGVPGFVKGVFACELYLKILVGDKAKALKGKERHNLYALYRLLDKTEKEKLNSVSNGNDLNLEELLKSIGHGFIDWRYIYEDGNEDFGDNHLFLYTEVFLNGLLPPIKAMAHSILRS